MKAKGKSKPKAKAKAKATTKAAAASKASTAQKKKIGAAKQGHNGQFELGNVLAIKKPRVYPPMAFQDAQRIETYSVERLGRAWAIVDAWICAGSLEAAQFAIRMACGREPTAQPQAMEPATPIQLELPPGFEPPPWMAMRKKVENVSPQQAAPTAGGGIASAAQ